MAPVDATTLPSAPFCSSSVRRDQDVEGMSAYTKHVRMASQIGERPHLGGQVLLGRVVGLLMPRQLGLWRWNVRQPCTYAAAMQVCVPNLVCSLSPPPAQARLPHTHFIRVARQLPCFICSATTCTTCREPTHHVAATRGRCQTDIVHRACMPARHATHVRVNAAACVQGIHRLRAHRWQFSQRRARRPPRAGMRAAPQAARPCPP
jgi:hypothetical protein